MKSAVTGLEAGRSSGQIPLRFVSDDILQHHVVVGLDGGPQAADRGSKSAYCCEGC